MIVLIIVIVTAHIFVVWYFSRMLCIEVPYILHIQISANFKLGTVL